MGVGDLVGFAVGFLQHKIVPVEDCLHSVSSDKQLNLPTQVNPGAHIEIVGVGVGFIVGVEVAVGIRVFVGADIPTIVLPVDETSALVVFPSAATCVSEVILIDDCFAVRIFIVHVPTMLAPLKGVVG